MKPIHQTLFGTGTGGVRGNCFAACIASILEMPLEEVPHFCNHADWRGAANAWLKRFDLFYVDFLLPGDMRDELVSDWGYHVISGMGPRGIRHSVVGLAGKMVYDPYPGGGGLVGDDFEYGLLVSKNPCCKKGGREHGLEIPGKAGAG